MRRALKRPFRYLLFAAGAVALVPAFVILMLRFVNPPTSAYIIRAKLGGHAPVHRRWVDLDAMAACMPLAAVAAEDQTFLRHHGFAWSAIGEAIAENAEGGRLRGASTISQQTAKNLFLWPAKTYARKAIEAYLTVWLELLWSKHRIIEVYLNMAQFGDRIFGVGAAAKRLFGRSPARLTRGQCAALAAVLPDPRRYNAARPGPYVRKQKAWILRQMQHLGPGYLAPMLKQ